MSDAAANAPECTHCGGSNTYGGGTSTCTRCGYVDLMATLEASLDTPPAPASLT